MKEQELEQIKQEYQKIGRAFPEDGSEARSSMVCYRDLQSLSVMIADGEPLSKKDLIAYDLYRRMAIHYGMDISDLPERLGKVREGDLEMIGMIDLDNSGEKK